MSSSVISSSELEIVAANVIEFNDSFDQSPIVLPAEVMEQKIASLVEKTAMESEKEQPIPSTSDPTQRVTIIMPNCEKSSPEKPPLEDDHASSIQIPDILYSF